MVLSPLISDHRPVRLNHGPGEKAEHAVVRVDKLLAKGNHAEHLPPELREGAAPDGHLDFAQRRPDRLGSKARELDGNRLLGQTLRRIVEPDPGGGVERTEGIYAVEDEVGPAVPEVGEVEDRVDHGRRIARLYPPRIDAAECETPDQGGRPAVNRGAGVTPTKLVKRPPGSDDVIGVAKDGRGLEVAGACRWWKGKSVGCRV